jgi:hypothetical protein
MRNKNAIDPKIINISKFKVEPARINFINYQENSM